MNKPTVTALTTLLAQLSKQNNLSTGLLISDSKQLADNIQLIQHSLTIDWTQQNITTCLNSRFTQQYDIAVVDLTHMQAINNSYPIAHLPQTSIQLLTELRDMKAKQILTLLASPNHTLNAHGFEFLSQLIDKNQQPIYLWQFNILTYKTVPDWLNAKYWANPENFDKYRW